MVYEGRLKNILEDIRPPKKLRIMSVRRGRAKRAFPPWKLDQEPKIYRKLEISSSVSVFHLIPAMTFFGGMALSLHKSQVHCSGIMQ